MDEVAVNVPVVAPAATLTDPGTDRLPLLSVSAMLILDGAAASSVTVHDAVEPPVRVDGEHERELNCDAAGCKVRVDRTVTPDATALTVTDWLVVTAPAVAVKLAVVAPVFTVMDAGTVKRLLEELSVADRLVVAALVNVSTQFDVALAATVEGVQDNVDKAAGATRLRFVVTGEDVVVVPASAVTPPPPRVAVSCALASVVRDDTVTEKVPVD